MTIKQSAHRAAHLTVRQLQQRVHELHAEEDAGVSDRTPLLAFAGVWLFLLPLLLLMLGAALAAYYLA